MRRSALYTHKFFFGLIIIWMSSASVTFAADSLATRLDRLVSHSKWSKMRIGVRVETLGENPVLVYDHQGTELFKPASNQKIVTAAAAMCLLPRDFKFQTTLARHGSDLVLIGSGDPSFGDPRIAERVGQPITGVFHAWADKLKARGVTTIPGDLLYDDFIFDQTFLHPGWSDQKNLAAWYTAPVGGLNFANNCVGVVIKPGPKPGAAVEVTLIPTTPWIQLQNKAVTASKGQPLVHRIGKGPVTITVNGKVSRASSAAAPLWITITDPGTFFATTARTALAARGIRIVGQTQRHRFRQPGKPLPHDLDIVAVHETRIADFLWRMNKRSVNMYAEALLKTLGAHRQRGRLPEQGTVEKGQVAVGQFLEALGMSKDSYVIDDGSGLSHHNRLAPRVLTAVLRYMDRHPDRQVWWDSLARPGEQGATLTRRMKDLGDKVFAKTGHINGVSALSGYVLGPDQRRYAFSVICEGSGGHPVQDGVCRILATWDGTSSGRAR